MTAAKNISCPSCGKNATWKAENAFRPFCSERCKLIDLGGWADESHRIPGENAQSEGLDKAKDSGGDGSLE